jgi:type IV secretion system protein VirB10
MSLFGRSPEAGNAPASELDESDVRGIEGERGIPSIHRSRSLQSRLSSILAMGLMTTLGVGLLTWYYTGAITRRSHAQQIAITVSKSKAQGEMPLPALGHFEAPKMAPPPPPEAKPLAEQVLGPPPALPPEPPIQLSASPATPVGVSPAGPVAKTPGELAFERRMQGAVFAKESLGNGAMAPVAPTTLLPENITPASVAAPAAAHLEPVRGAGTGELAGLLTPSVTPAAQARLLPTRRLLLSKGAFIDCTLETAIDSTLPGMTTCITATDTFSADGQVVLLERGTKLVGETQGQVQQGAARLFVLWTEARTPTGVVIPLASPGTDEIGRSGVTGEVNRHFWERFGAAILISVVNGAIQAGVQATSSNNGTVIVNPSATSDVMTEVLRSTVNIAPTITKPQGDRIQVLVARDLDFRSVYELRTAASAVGKTPETP